MGAKRVSFRGHQVTPDWPERLRQAQLQPLCEVKGVDRPRIRYGDESHGWPSHLPCHDCVAIKGEFHVPGCDVEQCPECGGQLWMGCDCDAEEADAGDDDDDLDEEEDGDLDDEDPDDEEEDAGAASPRAGP